MKVIDLLNKIANGEEVPKKILYRDYEYSFKDSEYRDFMDDWVGYDNLNYEIEIIEENKPIEKIKYEGKFADAEHQEMRNKINEIIDRLNNLEKGNENE